MRENYPREELMMSGHLACQGCGGSAAMRHVLKAMGPDTIVVQPACCWTIIAGMFPYNALKVPVLHTAFETSGAALSGIKAALDMKGDTKTQVMAFAGDGGTFDIGLQALSGAAERNEDVIYFCYDNEAYMNTGVQRSGATPDKAWTTTTPANSPKQGPKKDMVQILAGHKAPYVATANVAFPEDLIAKVKKAKEIRGTKFIHILSPCPPGWKTSSEQTIEIARLATYTKVFPVYEVFHGEEYRINIEPRDIPVFEYLKLQGRFRHLTKEDVEAIQRRVDYDYKVLLRKAQQEKLD
ncbi:MAG: pyruvate synthase subunit beta [Myxococcales bacterium]|nr:pyruvate synthase subunit beta [Myxococcales bacterium]